MQLLLPKFKNILITLFFAFIATDTLSAQNQPDSLLAANQYLEKAEKLNENAKYDSALFYAKKASTVYKEIKDWEKYIKSLNTIGASHFYLATYDSTLSLALKALSVGLKNLKKDHPVIAEVYGNIGAYYQFKGNYDSSLVYNKAARKVLLKNHDNNHPEVATILNNIGLCYQSKGDYNKAIDYYKNAIKIWKLNFGKDYAYIAIAYNNLGLCYYYKSNYETALNFYNEALKINLQKYGNEHPLVSDCYNRIGLCFEGKGNYKKALEYYHKALAIREKVFGLAHPKVALVLSSMGESYRNEGDYEKALNSLQKAISIQEKVLGENHPNLVYAYNNIGLCFQDKGLYDKALDYFKKNLKIQLKFLGENHPKTASLYYNMSLSYSYKGDEALHLLYLNKALKIGLQSFGEKHSLIGTVYNSLGSYYLETNNFGEARKYYFKALGVFKKIYNEDHHRTGSIFNNLASLHRRRSNYDSSLYYYEKSLNLISKQLGETHKEIALVCNNIGLLHLELNNYDKAFYFLNKALDIDKRTAFGKHIDLARDFNSIGSYYQKKGSNDDALKAYQSSMINLIDNFNDKNIFSNPSLVNSNISSRMILLKVLLNKANALKEAFTKKDIKYLTISLQTYALASQLIDDLRFELGQENISFLNKRSFDAYEGGIDVAHDLFQSTNDSNYLHQAFTFAEKSKAFFLQKALRESKAESFANFPDSLAQLEKALKVEQAFYRKKLVGAKEQEDSTKIFLYQDYLFEKKKKFDSLILFIENTYPKYYQLKYQVTTPHTHQVQESLPDYNSFVLEFFEGHDKVFLFAISKKNFQLHQIHKDSTISQSISNLRNIVSQHDKDYSSSFVTSAKLLYDQLIRPVSSFIQSEQTSETPKLIIIPDGQFHYLPFELLLTEDAKTIKSYKDLPYLICDFSISYNLSANIWMNSLSNTKSSSAQCLAFAPIYEVSPNTSINNSITLRGNLSNLSNKDKLSNLPGAIKEVEAISQLVDGSFFFGNEATESNFKENAANYQVLHLAMHGIVDDKHPENSKLIFTSSNDSIHDDSLHVYEIYTMNIPSELVVLSACQTGDGQLEQGEGIVSLARAFAFAGSPSLMMSMWQTSDQQAVTIMKYFYESLGEGFDKDDALRAAKLKYLKSTDANIAHPFFWAAFVSMGNTNSINFQRSSQWIWWIAGAFLIIGVSIAFWKRSKNEYRS